MSDTTPAPIHVPRKPTTAVRAAGRFWSAAVLAGLAAVVVAILDREAQLRHVRETAADIAAATGGTDVEAVVQLAFWGTLGLLVIVFLVQAILTSALLRGVGWTRWVLLGFLALNLGALVPAAGFLTRDSLTGTALLLPLQAVLAVVALICTFLPATTRWFREGRSAR